MPYSPQSRTGRRPGTAVLFGITAAALLVVCAARLPFSRAAAPAQATPVQVAPESAYTAYYSPKPAASQEREESYLVTVYRGRIGVFRGQETQPVLTRDVQVYLLPEEDQRLLRRGIPATGMAQVKGILEDYCG